MWVFGDIKSNTLFHLKQSRRLKRTLGEGSDSRTQAQDNILGEKKKKKWGGVWKRSGVPGAQLVLAPPGEFTEAFVALVVVVEHAVEGGSAQVHQGVVGRLLLLAAGVTVEEVVDLISYFWKGRHGDPSVTHGDKTRLVVKRVT